jgi:hypothetical protein
MTEYRKLRLFFIELVKTHPVNLPSRSLRSPYGHCVSIGRTLTAPDLQLEQIFAEQLQEMDPYVVNVKL